MLKENKISSEIKDKINFLSLLEEKITSKIQIENLHTIEKAKAGLYPQMTKSEIYEIAELNSRIVIEKSPHYSYVAAGFLLSKMQEENPMVNNLENFSYTNYFPKYIKFAVQQKLLSKDLEDFNLEELAQALQNDLDAKFKYMGLKLIYDRYLIRNEETIIELPQAMFMRVAMGLAIKEKNKNEKAIEFYKLLANFSFMSSTPTLFHSGTIKNQLSSCFLTTIDDDIRSIYENIKKNAMLSKHAGGLGNDWTSVRATGAKLKFGGRSQGVIPFLKVVNATAVAVNQGGKRKGSVCAYIEIWHADIKEFIELRKNTGDERRRAHDIETAVWIPDLFMERLIKEENWSLFCPQETPDLHDAYGKDFEILYRKYEKLGQEGKLEIYKQIPAKKLWQQILSMLYETGHPWITFKDPCNIRSPQKHVGIVHSSNLCTEITLNTSEDEIAVCNLGSININEHIVNGKIEWKKLEKSVNTAIRMLDNVIDINFYPVEEAKNSNMRHRPIGLGLMGWQDILYKMKIPFDSQEAVELSDTIMEKISYFAISQSCELAKEKGKYKSFDNSLWSKGILPIDSIQILAKDRITPLEQDLKQTQDWNTLRQKIVKNGMRNSNVLAIAPTATIANICGVTHSIEPIYQNYFVKSNMSGDFININAYLVEELKNLNLWNDAMIQKIKKNDGIISEIEEIPQKIKNIYKTAFEIDPKWIIECASRRQKWIDQAQSINLFFKLPDGKKIDEVYKQAWKKGLKTTYYCRSLGATHVEKTTVSIKEQALNQVEECEVCQ